MSGPQLAYAAAPVALGSSVVPIAPSMGAFRSRLAATPQPRERQRQFDDATNFEG